MSSRKGSGNTRTRKPAHQNTFAFRHNPKSQKTAKILASPITGLCASCHDKVEWRKKYRKYRPLRQPATCNDCHKKTVTAAYHRICGPCAKERRVCPFCCTKGRPRQTEGDVEETVDEQEGEDNERKYAGGAVGCSDGEDEGDREEVVACACDMDDDIARQQLNKDDGVANGEEKDGTGDAVDITDR
ncbi:unnamed protein product [Sphacelaria rigidula]